MDHDPGMTNLQKVKIQLSEVREKINGMIGLDEADRSETFTADLRALSTKSTDLEVEYRACEKAEADDHPVEKATTITLDAETQELLELREKSRFGRFLATEISGRALDGVEAEYRSAVGAGDGTVRQRLVAPAVRVQRVDCADVGDRYAYGRFRQSHRAAHIRFVDGGRQNEGHQSGQHGGKRSSVKPRSRGASRRV